MHRTLATTLLTAATALVATTALHGAPAVAAPTLAKPTPAKPTPVVLTIGGNDGPEGLVKSGKRVCKAMVVVKVFRQVGARGGGDDRLVGSDTTGAQAGRWAWSIGNPGLDDGDRVYATTAPHDGCKRAFSPTMTVVKD